MNKRGYFDKRLLLVPIGLVVVGVFVWLLFFLRMPCDDWDCFNDALKNCKRVSFIGGTDMVFQYKINGIRDDRCEVGAKLLQGELNNQDSLKLEGQEMKCSLPKGVVMIPESDISNCHGLLKEGLQDLVIKELYSYLVQNIGKINLELVDANSLS